MSTPKPINFEQAFKELEKIVADLESETVSLDESLEKFKRGLELASLLKGRIKEVEAKVETIKQKFGVAGGAETDDSTETG